ncbi:MAG: sugar nucleotide-binding protein [Proteobacteria bacterium]|nr:sugar nucleotide-binding protein [Pseudomonadota bacterium]
MTRVLVTGASGYVGARLCGMAPPEMDLWGTRLNGSCPPGVREVFCDLLDEDSIRRAVASSRPDLVFHLAYDFQRPEEIIAQGTCRLLDALEPRPVARVLLLSTDMVFDGDCAPYSEKDEPCPITPYGRAKREAEESVLSMGGLVIRTSLVYGSRPLDPRSRDLLAGLRGQGFGYPYFTDEVRSPVWVDGLCVGLWEVARLERPPGILHLAGPQALDRHAFATRLAGAWGFPEESIPKGSLAAYPYSRPRNTSLDIGLARRILGFSPRSVARATVMTGSE